MDAVVVPERSVLQTEFRTREAADLALLVDAQTFIEAASTGQRRQPRYGSVGKDDAAAAIAIRDRLLGISNRDSEIIDHQSPTLVVAGELAQEADNSVLPEHCVISLSVRS